MRLILFIGFLLILLIHCSDNSNKPVFVTSINPVYLIIKEITGTNSKLINLLGAGSSPHTYSPKPSDIKISSSAKAIFYVSESIDEWVAKLSGAKKLKLFDLLPDSLKLKFNEPGSESLANEFDPHFWTDPLTVKSIIPQLTEILTSLEPKNSASYKKNADRFIKQLDTLNLELEQIFQNIKNKNIFLYHPSFLYMLKRYNFNYCGSIETYAGKEPSPKDVAELVKSIKSFKVKAIFTEPQLPERLVKVIADAAHIEVYQLDPLGAIKGIKTYSDIILYNARTLQKALK